MGLVLGFGLFMIIGTVLAILLMYKIDRVVTWIYKKREYHHYLPKNGMIC